MSAEANRTKTENEPEFNLNGLNGAGVKALRLWLGCHYSRHFTQGKLNRTEVKWKRNDHQSLEIYSKKFQSKLQCLLPLNEIYQVYVFCLVTTRSSERHQLKTDQVCPKPNMNPGKNGLDK